MEERQRGGGGDDPNKAVGERLYEQYHNINLVDGENGG
jgi:hypothetical protein